MVRYVYRSGLNRIGKTGEGRGSLKKYIAGSILSIVIFIILIIINQQVFDNVMPLSAPIAFLVSHVVVFAQLVPEKKWFRYLFFLLILGAVIYLSIPEFTQGEARELIHAEYGELALMELESVPTTGGNDWNPFNPGWAYAFEAEAPETGEPITLMVVPDSGKVFEIEPYR